MDKLKAALQIAETQAHDIQLGQPATIDTHNGVVHGQSPYELPSAFSYLGSAFVGVPTASAYLQPTSTAPAGTSQANGAAVSNPITGGAHHRVSLTFSLHSTGSATG